MKDHYILKPSVCLLMSSTGGVMGGLEKHCFDLASELSKYCKISLIIDESYLHQAQCMLGNSVGIYSLPLKLSRNNPILLFKLYKLLKKIQPIILHAQAGKSTSLVSNIKYFFPETKFIATIHGMHSSVKAYLKMEAVIAVSESLKSCFPSSYPLHLIPNGIRSPNPYTDQHTLRNELKILPNEKLIIAVGRLDAVKGFDWLIDTFSKMPKNLKLKIIGDGDLRSELQKKISEKSLITNVEILGWKKDVMPFLQSADLCLVTSKSEGFSYVIIEALMSKCPVISTKVGIAPTVLPSYWLVDYDDADMLITKTIELLNLGNEAARGVFDPYFKNVDREYSLDTMAKSTLNLYKILIAKRN